ncbi:thiamine phosphate synthase [Magnetospira thiophila]
MPTLTDLARRLNQRGTGGLSPLILLTDCHRLPDPTVLLQRLPMPCLIILRHPDAVFLRQLAQRVTPLCQAQGHKVLIANEARLAWQVGADGLHLSESALSAGRAWWKLWSPPHWILTAAAHSPLALQRAEKAGVAAVLLSPVFATRSHPGGQTLGSLRFAQWARGFSGDVYALGGIQRETICRLLPGPASGVAGIDLFQA